MKNPIENYQLIQQFPYGDFSIFQLVVLVLQSSTLLFWFTHCSHHLCFQPQWAADFSKKAHLIVHYLSSTKQQTDKVSDYSKSN